MFAAETAVNIYYSALVCVSVVDDGRWKSEHTVLQTYRPTDLQTYSLSPGAEMGWPQTAWIGDQALFARAVASREGRNGKNEGGKKDAVCSDGDLGSGL